MLSDDVPTLRSVVLAVNVERLVARRDELRGDVLGDVPTDGVDDERLRRLFERVLGDLDDCRKLRVRSAHRLPNEDLVRRRAPKLRRELLPRLDFDDLSRPRRKLQRNLLGRLAQHEDPKALLELRLVRATREVPNLLEELSLARVNVLLDATAVPPPVGPEFPEATRRDDVDEIPEVTWVVQHWRPGERNPTLDAHRSEMPHGYRPLGALGLVVGDEAVPDLVRLVENQDASELRQLICPVGQERVVEDGDRHRCERVRLLPLEDADRVRLLERLRPPLRELLFPRQAHRRRSDNDRWVALVGTQDANHRRCLAETHVIREDAALSHTGTDPQGAFLLIRPEVLERDGCGRELRHGRQVDLALDDETPLAALLDEELRTVRVADPCLRFGLPPDPGDAVTHPPKRLVVGVALDVIQAVLAFYGDSHLVP